MRPVWIACTAPFVFTKILKPVAQYLRSQSFLSVIYLDDFLLIGKSKQECTKNVQISSQLIERLGFIINKEKSILEPMNEIKYLGFIWNTTNMKIELTRDKKESIYLKAQELLNIKKFKIRKLAEFLGTLIAASPAVKYSLLYTKNLERQKFLALNKHKGNFEKSMSLHDSVLPDVHWWIKNIPFANNSFQVNKFKIEIYSDASLTGWGVVCNKTKLNGWWNNDQRKHHINYLELLAAFYGLKCFAEKLHSTNILLRIDNTTAISYINKMGSIQYPKLSKFCKDIWTRKCGR